MRIYVAAKFEMKALVASLYHYLKRAGHVITYDWLGAPDQPSAAVAYDEIEGVRTADAVVVVAHPLGCGLWVELGAALALGKRVLLIGDTDCPFAPHALVERYVLAVDALRVLGCRIP